jgi:regulatory protein
MTEFDSPSVPPNRDRLRRAAWHYLQRYSASEAHLSRILARKLKRWASLDGTTIDPEQAAEAIAAVLEDCRTLGVVDDQAFAASKVSSSRRKGLSAAKIAAKLSAKGVDRETTTAALTGDDTDDRTAALLFARRKRLGPWRNRVPADVREADRRDLAALCRNGFSLGDARRVVGMDRETAEAELAGDGGE